MSTWDYIKIGRALVLIAEAGFSMQVGKAAHHERESPLLKISYSWKISI